MAVSGCARHARRSPEEIGTGATATMYFVTTKREGYVLFCLTPSERAAVGVTEKRRVDLLVRNSPDQDLTVVRSWNGDDYSHTEFLSAWHHREEPTDPKQLLSVLPEKVREIN